MTKVKDIKRTHTHTYTHARTHTHVYVYIYICVCVAISDEVHTRFPGFPLHERALYGPHGRKETCPVFTVVT